MTPQTYSGNKKAKYTLGREIGRGGEGAVFQVQEDSSIVAKIYISKTEKDKADKLAFMASITDTELLKFAAWPLDVLRDSAMNVCGFTMKKLDGFVPLHSLFSPMERKKLFPDKGYNFLVHVAKNLAIAFHRIHEAGIIMGDVNEANILVNASGLIALIDCDSFQVKNGNTYHFCEVGVARYTPPELLEKGSFTNVIRTVNTDTFSLATLIFQLLFMGRAPFTGTNLTSEDIDEEKAIRTNEFAYSLKRNNKKLTPAKNSLDLRFLSRGLIDAFHATFENRDNRPLPAQWVKELETFGKEISICHHSKLHYYPRTMAACPWCSFKEKAGIVYFLDDSYLKNIPELNNIEQFINGFKLEKLTIKKLTEHYQSPGIIAAPIEITYKTFQQINVAVMLIAIVTFLTLAATVHWAFIIGAMLFIPFFNRLSPTHTKLKEEQNKRKEVYDRLLLNFRALIKKHNQPNEIHKYNQSAGKLTNLITGCRQLPAEFMQCKKIIEEKYYNRQLQIYLEQFDIRDYPIPSFGPAKKKLIFTNGIKNAADILKLNSNKITGIGPKNHQVLLDWRRQMSFGFAYTPDSDSIENEIKQAARDITTKKFRLEVEVRTEYKNLLILRDNIISAGSVLERQYEQLSKKVYQAKLDLEAFQKLSIRKFW